MFKQILFISLLALAHAAVTQDNIAGVYTLQHGSTCADNLEILVNSTTLPAATILASNVTCSGPKVTLTKASKETGQPSLTSFLLSTAIGDFFTANVEELTCGNFAIKGPLFLFRPEDDFKIPEDKLALFPKLNDSLPNGILLSDQHIYIFVNSCVYNKRAPEDPGIIDNIVSTITECLPADASVHTSNGVIPIEKVDTGTKVLSSADTYTPIIAWTHHEATVFSNFVKISFENSNTSIAITPGHYVYADGKAVPARLVRKGMLMKGLYGALVVHDVGVIQKRGLFNPQTISGDIVVDGVVVSTYTEAVSPVMAHALLAPVRLAFDLFTGLSGLFEKDC